MRMPTLYIYINPPPLPLPHSHSRCCSVACRNYVLVLEWLQLPSSPLVPPLPTGCQSPPPHHLHHLHPSYAGVKSDFIVCALCQNIIQGRITKLRIPDGSESCFSQTKHFVTYLPFGFLLLLLFFGSNLFSREVALRTTFVTTPALTT